MKILGIVPARGGSKGVPRKNIKPLGGKPLIQYTIDAALKAKGLASVMVSTEDEEIASFSLKIGAEVPILRPPHLATDRSPTIDTVIHVVEWYRQRKNEYFDAICLLQPTTPFRTSADIAAAIRVFQAAGADSLITVVPVPHEFNPHWVFEPDSTGKYLHIATGETTIIPRRQELPPAYHRNGAIYLTKTSTIEKKHSLYGDKISFYVMDKSPQINIDTLQDWEEAEKMVHEINMRC